jgi:hypothetical protein
MGEGKDVYRVLVERPEWKRPLGRTRRMWKDNIKMDLRETDILPAPLYTVSIARLPSFYPFQKK